MSKRTIPKRVILTCDKCGVTDEDPEKWSAFVGGGASMATVQHAENASTHSQQIDLCGNCNRKFHLWLKEQ